MATRLGRVRHMRRENTKITKLGRGRYRLQLVVGNQYFTIHAGGDEVFESMKRAKWHATMLAIALNRMVYGD